ncbi:protein NYNRIN-like [Grus japonensis]
MFLAMNEESEESLSHDCLQTIEEVYSSRSDLHDELLTNPDLELFTDGSSFVQDGKRRAGYAVVTTTEVVEAEALPSTRRRRKRN